MAVDERYWSRVGSVPSTPPAWKSSAQELSVGWEHPGVGPPAGDDPGDSNATDTKAITALTARAISGSDLLDALGGGVLSTMAFPPYQPPNSLRS
jgi:hypothetical protein